MVFGNHFVKSRLTNQAAIAISSGEAGYNRLVKAASIRDGIKAIAFELGIESEGPVELHADASAAIGIGNRIGSGKVRHIEVCQVMSHDKLSKKVSIANKVGTDDNLRDALTKGVDSAAIKKHSEGVGIVLRADKQRLAGPKHPMER